MRIAVVDDMLFVCRWVADILWEHDVETFQRPEDFLRSPRFDLLVLGYNNQPAMNGADTLREMARRNITMPTIGLSGNPDGLDLMMNLGAVAAIEKPFLDSDLLAAVAEGLDRKLKASAIS